MLKDSRILFTGEQVETRLREIAGEIVSHKLPSMTAEIILVPILEGAVFASRKFGAFIEEEFGGCAPCMGGLSIIEKPIRIKRSRGTELVEPQLVDFHYSEGDFRGKFVIIVDDIVDEGQTLKLAHETVKAFRPAVLLSIVLVKKCDIDTVGWLDNSCFELGYTHEEARKRWLYGWGMDINGLYREQNHIYEVIL